MSVRMVEMIDARGKRNAKRAEGIRSTTRDGEHRYGSNFPCRKKVGSPTPFFSPTCPFHHQIRKKERKEKKDASKDHVPD